MKDHQSLSSSAGRPARTRRGFLGTLGRGAAAGPVAAGWFAASGTARAAAEGTVARRPLGRTGLEVSQVGFGGHSWAYKRVPDGSGGFRAVTLSEAERMIGAGLEMGVNFFDSCTPPEEHSVPGEVIKRMKKRKDVIVSARLCHRQTGVKEDRQIIYDWVDERLKLWQTDYFDLLMLSNTENDTPMSGYWDMTWSIEALEKVKQQGKVRFAGFGSHFTPELFLLAFEKFGRFFDVTSAPYNVRHRAAEQVIPAARKAGLGMVTIKPFARGSLLKGRDLEGADQGLARDMIAFVLQNPQVDVCICGMHTEAQVRENFSASWVGLTPEAKQRLELAAATPGAHEGWLERGWRYA